jgi:hypothetical protein
MKVIMTKGSFMEVVESTSEYTQAHNHESGLCEECEKDFNEAIQTLKHGDRDFYYIGLMEMFEPIIQTLIKKNSSIGSDDSDSSGGTCHYCHYLNVELSTDIAMQFYDNGYYERVGFKKFLELDQDHEDYKTAQLYIINEEFVLQYLSEYGLVKRAITCHKDAQNRLVYVVDGLFDAFNISEKMLRHAEAVEHNMTDQQFTDLALLSKRIETTTAYYNAYILRHFRRIGEIGDVDKNGNPIPIEYFRKKDNEWKWSTLNTDTKSIKILGKVLPLARVLFLVNFLYLNEKEEIVLLDPEKGYAPSNMISAPRAVIAIFKKNKDELPTGISKQQDGRYMAQMTNKILGGRVVKTFESLHDAAVARYELEKTIVAGYDCNDRILELSSAKQFLDANNAMAHTGNEIVSLDGNVGNFHEDNLVSVRTNAL